MVFGSRMLAASKGDSCCACLREWLLRRHSLWTEALTVLVIYLAYEVSRGITVGDPSVALHHAHQVAHLEQSLSIFVEREVQVVAKAIPGLLGVLGAAYLGLPLTVSIGCLVWVYRYHPSAFTMLRNTLVLATAIAMIGYIAFPTAPPRLAGMGIVDTVSNGHVDLNTGLVHSLYNPFAAMPSLHFGYAVIIGAERGCAESPPGRAARGCRLPRGRPLCDRRDREPLPPRRAGRRSGRGRSCRRRTLAHAQPQIPRRPFSGGRDPCKEVTPSASDVATSPKVAMSQRRVGGS